MMSISKPGFAGHGLHYVLVKTVVSVGLVGIRLQQAERQDLSCTYLAHHELEGVFIVIIVIIISKPEPAG